KFNLILQGIEDCLLRINNIKISKEKFLIRDSLERLHTDAIEIYKKILEEIYCRINDVANFDFQTDNNKMYIFFRKKHEDLLIGFDKSLRNDISHLTYENRDGYDEKMIYDESINILIRSISALNAQSKFLIKFYNNSLKTIQKVI
ncbi:hypothetical protein ACFLTH_17250, partial [Bacteroidota bacterium]